MKRVFLLSVIALPICAPSHSLASPDEFLNVSITGNRYPAADIETNLPDGFQLSLDIENMAGVPIADADVKVSHGHVHVSHFNSLPNGGLLSGVYKLDILSVMTDLQESPAVKNYLGSSGENLNGPDVQDGTLGRSIITHRTFTVR